MSSTPDAHATIRAALWTDERIAFNALNTPSKDAAKYVIGLLKRMRDEYEAKISELDTLAAGQEPLICATCNDYLEAGARCEICYGNAVSAYEETEEELEALKEMRAGQEWTPITGHIIMCISGEIQDVQAHSISGLPLPANVAVCKLTQPNKENSDLE